MADKKTAKKDTMKEFNIKLPSPTLRALSKEEIPIISPVIKSTKLHATVVVPISAAIP